MKFIKSFLLISIVLGFVACNNSTNSQETKNIKKKEKKLDKSIVKDWNKQENNDLEIYYPQGWKFNASGEMGALFFIYSPLENENDLFQDNINLVVHPLASNDIDLNEYYIATFSDIKKQLLSVNVQEEEQFFNNNIEIQKVVFSAIQEDFVLMVQQYYFIHKQEAYIMTFTAEEIKFDDYIEFVDLIMESFKFKK